MKSSEYRDAFKAFPEAGRLAYSIYSFQSNANYSLLARFLSGHEDIQKAPLEKLLEMKGQFFMMGVEIQSMIKHIEELQLDYPSQFEDAMIPMEEIGVKEGDRFECLQELEFNGLLKMMPGSIIVIKDFSYGATKSMFVVSIEKLETDGKIKNVDWYSVPLVVMIADLENKFKKM